MHTREGRQDLADPYDEFGNDVAGVDDMSGPIDDGDDGDGGYF